MEFGKSALQKWCENVDGEFSEFDPIYASKGYKCSVEAPDGTTTSVSSEEGYDEMSGTAFAPVLNLRSAHSVSGSTYEDIPEDVESAPVNVEVNGGEIEVTSSWYSGTKVWVEDGKIVYDE